jgi:hypothetical protein
MRLEDFLELILTEINLGLEKQDLNFKRIKKIIGSWDIKLLEKLNNLKKRFPSLNKSERLKFFKRLFFLSEDLLNQFKEPSLEISFSGEFVSNFIQRFLKDIIIDKRCSECQSNKISESSYAFNENKIIYFCSECQKNVKMDLNTTNIPLLLIYLENWIKANKNEFIWFEKNSSNISERKKSFLMRLFVDSFHFFKQKGDLSRILLFYKILAKNSINPDKFRASHETLDEIIVNTIIHSLRSGDFSKIKYSLEHLIKDHNINLTGILSNPKFKVLIEKSFYKALKNYLETRNFENFRKLINNSDKLDIFIDVHKIKNRFKIIAHIIRECIHNVSVGYQTASLGEIIDILRFCNEFELLQIDLTPENRSKIRELRRDQLLIKGLQDLFGKISDSFIYYIYKEIPAILYDFFTLEYNKYAFSTGIEQMISIVKNFFQQYSIYGLSVKNLGSIEYFVEEFINQYKNYKKKGKKKERFMKFSIKYKYRTYYYGSQDIREEYEIKKHLVSPKNILKNLDKIKSREDYNFYNLSMVLIGGLGPQGHGFTYSTPKGEVIEICSDRRENEAIIIKFKRFLKTQFLKKMEKELEKQHLKSNIIDGIISYLLRSLDKKELVNYTKKDYILKHVEELLYDELGPKRNLIDPILKKINHTIDLILRPINMIDQFKCRMDLIQEDKIKLEDIAKFTSLRGKSHFDVLRERFFYQYIVNWFYNIHIKKRE